MAPTTESPRFERLPADPSPVHYDLTYSWVSLKESTEFEGTVEVALSFTTAAYAQATSTVLRLNSLNLTIVSAKLNDISKKPRNATKIVLLPLAQELQLEFPGPTQQGHATLTIEFRGRLNEQLAGFYKSKISENMLMGVTQFEATDARRAFPCWDEPARKATFKLMMTVPQDALVLSNTRPKSKTTQTSKWPSGEARDGVTWEFYPTPKMSTYLLAWVVTPAAYALDSLSAQSPVPPFVETVVYVPKGKLKQAEFACTVGVKALDFFAGLFDLAYPLPLMQHVGCPDFAAGAMENFGCITYREARLLVDPATTTSTAKRDVARVVCHELAHQWFGNSTTMEWWTDLWLNEGFARFCEFLAVDHIFPELDAWTTFDLDVVGTALRLDALKSSHAIRVDVGHPDEINEIFDAVSYAKGATVLRMLTHFLGGLDAFVNGVRLYLKEFRWKNAVSDDLWRALEMGANQPEGSIVGIMRSWTTQVGYPVVHVKAREDGTVVLSQERYLTVASVATESGNSNTSVKWTIPATVYSTATDEPEFFSVTPGEESPTLKELEQKLSSLEKDQGWFVLNGKGDLFRVCYTEEQWWRIAREACALVRVPNRTRLSLVRDVFDLAESGHLPVNISLNFAMTVLQPSSLERDPVVLLQTVSKLHSLVLAYSAEPFSQVFNGIIANNLGTLLEALGPWNPITGSEFFHKQVDPSKIDDLRVSTMRCAVDASNDPSSSPIASEAFARLERYCAGETSACPNDLRPAIFRMAASFSGQRALDLMLNERFDKVEAQEKREIFSSFAGLRTETELKRVVAFTRSDKVRGQDVPMCVASISASKLGARLLWSDFKDDFNWWLGKFSDGNFLWSGIVGNMTSGLPTEEEALEVVKFFEGHPGKLGSAKRALDQAVERVRGKVSQVARDRENVHMFIDGWIKA